MSPFAPSRAVAARACPPVGQSSARTQHRSIGLNTGSRAFGFSSQRSSSARGSRLVAEANKVALLGAAGGIGQPLALLLKLNEQISELRLYDIANVKGVAADLSHINSNVQASHAF